MDSQNKSFQSRLGFWVLLLFIAAGMAFTFPLLSKNYFWADENFTLELIERSYAQMIADTAADVHPPLYYLILKTVAELFGYQTVILRAASYFPVLLLQLFALCIVRKQFGNITAGGLILCSFLTQYTVTYNAELRMYSWAMLFVTLCGYGVYLIAADSSLLCGWFWLVLGGVGAAYTHYYAFMLIMVFYAMLLLWLFLSKKPLLPWGKAAAVSVLCYLPWLPSLCSTFFRTGKDWWLQIPSSLGETLLIFFGSRQSGMVLSAGAAGILVWRLYCIRKTWLQPASWLLLTTLAGGIGLLAAAYTASALIRPLWLARYLFPLSGLVWLNVSAGLQAVWDSRRMLWRGLVCLLALLLVYGGWKTRKGTLQDNAEINQHIEIALDFVNENLHEGDLLVSVEDDADIRVQLLRFYFPQAEIVDGQSGDDWLSGSDGIVLVAPEWQEIPEEWASKLANAGWTVAKQGSGRIADRYVYFFCLEK